MIDFKEQISVSKQCKVLNLERNFLYYALKAESEENLKTMLLMDKQYFNTPFYGYRKMTVWFKNQGFKINEKRTKRLMNLMNWRTIYREPKTTICNPEHKKYPYLLRNLVITHKNQVWATDITYIAMKQVLCI